MKERVNKVKLIKTVNLKLILAECMREALVNNELINVFI